MAKTKTAPKTAAKSKRRTRDVVVHDQIIKLDASIDTGHLEMAKLLHEAYHGQFHLNWGYTDDLSGFQGFVDAELNTNYRKVMYLVNIWDKVHDLGLDIETVEAIGWSKMKEIAPLMEKKKDANKWMKKAANLSFRDLAGEVKTEREKQGKARTNSSTKFTFVADSDEATAINDAINAAKAVCETKNDTTALEYICQEWLATVGATPEHMDLDKMLSFIEKTFEVKVNVEGAAEVTEKKTAKKAPAKKAAAKKAPAKSKAKKTAPKKAAKPEPVEEETGGESEGGDEAGIDDLLGL